VGWQTPYVYILLIVGVLLVAVFFYIELRVSPMPLLPLGALKDSSIAFVLACLACGWGCFGIWFYYVWQILLQLRELTPLLAAAWISPVAISGALAAIATGFLLSRVGAAFVMVAALTSFLLGACLLATTPIDQVYWAQTFVAMIVMPFGM
jgi:hypothetical protein